MRDVTFCDVTLRPYEGETVEAHRCILAAWSPVFARMFSSGFEEVKKGSVYIADTDGPTLEKLVSFMYAGELPITRATMQEVDLLVAADKYEVSELKQHLCSSLCELLNDEIDFPALKVADMHDVRPLRRASTNYILNKMDRAVSSVILKARLPFFNGSLDIIHSVNSIKYLPMLEFEEMLFEWDRVLRVSINSVKYLPMLEFEEMLFEWDRVLRVGELLHWLFSRPIERCQLDAENPLVMRQQLQCAAAELPLLEDVDWRFFGPSLAERIAELAGKGTLGRSPENPEVDRGWRYIGAGKRPALFVPVRAIDPNMYAVVEARIGRVLEEIEESKAFFVLYEGAVYLQQGRTFLVTSLDLDKREARCVRADVRYYTKTIDMVTVTIKGGTLAFPYPHMPSAKPASASADMTSAHTVLKEAMTSAAHASAPSEPMTKVHMAAGGVMTSAQMAPCEVTTRWIGYRKMWRGSGEPFETVEMTLPDQSDSLRSSVLGIQVRLLKAKCKDSVAMIPCSVHPAGDTHDGRCIRLTRQEGNKKGDQAVAVKAAGTRVAFYGCTFLGYQDTLYAVSGLQYYKNCVIQGRVDFVFGNAKALFHNCKFNLVYWGGGYFAQSREKGDDTGYVILGGSLSPLGPGPIKPGYLARSWGKYSTTIFVNTYFAAGSVRPEGWGYVEGNKKLRHVTFAVYGCYGPGYDTTKWEDTAKILKPAEAAPYSSISYVNQGGWITDPNVLVRGVGGKVNNSGGDGINVTAGNGSANNASSSSPKPTPPPALTSKEDKKSKDKQSKEEEKSKKRQKRKDDDD
ncbi:unnamed protein product [Closterium sp. Yama58-4]|nr:unnamed protein product [Closterium sp. Yama58-4]